MKSIEELARELVNRMEIEQVELTNWTEFKALKSAIEKPAEKEPSPEWPKWYDHGNFLYRYNSEASGSWFSKKTGMEYLTSYKHSQYIAALGRELEPIPTAEALAIIEKAKIK